MNKMTLNEALTYLSGGIVATLRNRIMAAVEGQSAPDVTSALAACIGDICDTFDLDPQVPIDIVIGAYNAKRQSIAIQFAKAAFKREHGLA